MVSNMANELRPFGARPIQSISSDELALKTRSFLIPAADTDDFGVGDFVVLTGDQEINPDDGKYYATIAKAAGGAATEQIVGAITGILSYRDPNNLYTGYRPAGAQSKAMVVQVPTDPDVTYVIQEDSDTASIPVNSAGANIQFIVGAVDPVTRSSTTVLDSDSVNTTDTFPLRLMRYDGSIDNEGAPSPYSLWEVKINNSPFNTKAGI